MEELNIEQEKELEELKKQEPKLGKAYEEAKDKIYNEPPEIEPKKEKGKFLLILILIAIGISAIIYFLPIVGEDEISEFEKGRLNASLEIIMYQSERGVALISNGEKIQEINLTKIYNKGLEECNNGSKTL